MGFTNGNLVSYLASCCSRVNATTGFNEQINLLMSLLDSDMAEFLLQLFAMRQECQETGVTVLTATGTYAAYKSSVVVFYSCCGAHIQLLSLLIW